MFENCQKRGERRAGRDGMAVCGVIVVTKAKKWGQGIDGSVCLSVCQSLLPLSPFLSLSVWHSRKREDETNKHIVN